MAEAKPLTRRLALFVLLVGVAGCAGPSRFSREPVRLSDLASEGDPARRASLRLVTRGLDSDSGGQAQLALSQYERAIQVDPNNPFAYLAIARHHVERGDPELGLQPRPMAYEEEGLTGRYPKAALRRRYAHISGGSRRTSSKPRPHPFGTVVMWSQPWKALPSTVSPFRQASSSPRAIPVS